MGLAERKEREKEMRRNLIVDAAEKIFFSKGTENAKIIDVANEAELGKGTIYLYFKNKNDLFHAIIVRALENLYSRFKEAIERETTGAEQVKAVGRAYFKFYKEEPDYFTALLHQESIDMDMDHLENYPCVIQCQTIGNSIFALIRESVIRGINDGTIKKNQDPNRLPMILWGLTGGILHIFKSKEIAIAKTRGIKIDDLWEDAFRLICEALEEKSPGTGE